MKDSIKYITFLDKHCQYEIMGDTVKVSPLPVKGQEFESLVEGWRKKI